MPKINILTQDIAQLIAAGEVVERPGSIVKEAVENSIDALSTAITVDINHGGNTFVRIVDNGCGIAREDVAAAFMPHATSKIASSEDLDSICTLGFRGEALASVASVAKVTMLTKTVDEDVGTRIIIHGGEIIDIDDYGCPDGTSLIVTDLFYNTPARRKFLKKDMTEAANISQIMDRLALSHPEVSFTFRRDGADVLFTPGDGRLMSAVEATLGKEIASGMREISCAAGEFEISGCVCLPVNSRPNRNGELFFLNGRFIKSRTFSAAIEQAYKDSIMAGKFPTCVLNIKMPCNQVDVNVHPTKTEVRFADEQAAFRAVFHAVKSFIDGLNVTAQGEIFPNGTTMSELTRPASFTDTPTIQGRLNYTAYVPAAEPQKKTGGYFTGAAADYFPQKTTETSLGRETSKEYIGTERLTSENMSSTPSQSQYRISQQDMRYPSFTSDHIKVTLGNAYDYTNNSSTYTYVGEAFSTYILAQKDDDLFIVDKHALHERIIYNRLKSETESFSQPLLTPISVSVTKDEQCALLSNVDLLSKAGFDVSELDGGRVLVRAMPMHFATEDIEASLEEIAERLLSDRTDISTDRAEWIYKNVACRAAIKAGDRSSKEELMRLLNMIDDVHYCPHGRPVTLKITKQRLEKEFHREQ